MKKGYVYILTNQYNSVLYIGVTNNIKRRLLEHREHKNKGFTNKYDVLKVVRVEIFNKITDAITREKQLKGWTRDRKLALIKEENPNFNDLYNDVMES